MHDGPAPATVKEFSALSAELSNRMWDYCLRAQSPYQEDVRLNAIHDFLEEHAAELPSLLLEQDYNGFSHFLNALRMPYITRTKKMLPISSERRLEKANTLLDLLLDTVHALEIDKERYADCLVGQNNGNLTLLGCAAATGDAALYEKVTGEFAQLYDSITPQDYARQFSQSNNNRFTPLHSAIAASAGQDTDLYDWIAAELDHQRPAIEKIEKGGYAKQFTQTDYRGFTPLHSAVMTCNVALYDKLSSKLESLHAQKLIDDNTYARQFTLLSACPSTALHSAARKGNVAMLQHLLADMGAHLPQDQLQQQLLTRRVKRDGTRNIFHSAMGISGDGRRPVMQALIDAFFQHFDKEDAGRHVTTLLSEPNERGETPCPNPPPPWLKEMLSLHETEGLRPRAQPRYAEGWQQAEKNSQKNSGTPLDTPAHRL